MFFRQIIKSFFAAFSLYSKIPLPPFKWDSEDMKFHLLFFPFVGALIAFVSYFLYKNFHITSPLIALLIPLLITGGFHVDGFMDTMDALHSYGDRQKKLEILKDPHVGAFSIISLLVFILILLESLSEIFENPGMEVIFLCHSFIISRILSALSVILFPKAKKEGMLVVESRTESRSLVIFILLAEMILDFLILGFYVFNHGKSLYDFLIFPLFIAVMLLAFLYYYLMSRKHFGGISGDLSGFFVCISEAAFTVAIAILKKAMV